MIQNGRVVRQEMKCGNIKAKIEQAWEIMETGLLANRYASLFADGLLMASFYTESIDADSHDAAKVINIEELRDKFVKDYKKKRLDMTTHPVMCRFSDNECDENRYVEIAKVAAVSCMHNCIPTICGGNKETGQDAHKSYSTCQLLN